MNELTSEDWLLVEKLGPMDGCLYYTCITPRCPNAGRHRISKSLKILVKCLRNNHAVTLHNVNSSHPSELKNNDLDDKN